MLFVWLHNHAGLPASCGAGSEDRHKDLPSALLTLQDTQNHSAELLRQLEHQQSRLVEDMKTLSSHAASLQGLSGARCACSPTNSMCAVRGGPGF